MAGNSIDHRKTCEPDVAAALLPLPPGIEPGAALTVRGRLWRLDACVERDDCRELHLRDSSGERRVLLWPFDRPSPLARAPRLRVVRLPMWTARTRLALARTIDVIAPRATCAGAILPYQIAPVLAVRSGVTRVLLADEVGLGKTVQAGWILADLLASDPAARALIAVPASLREQWLSELLTLFAVSGIRVDAAWLRGAVAERPPDISPWIAPGTYVGSIDFLKRTDVARSLGGLTWDLLIVDEAHGATAPTERHAALARIAAVARRVVLITATPYSGDAASLASMLALGHAADDPPPLMFRRSRTDVGDGRTRRHRFAMVRVGHAESRLQRLLERYTRDVWRQAPADVDGARLAMTILRKRALSSPAAAHRSLARRLELLRNRQPVARQLSLFDEEIAQDDALPEAALATPGLADATLETRWLTTLVDAAAKAIDADSKRRYLLRLIRRLRGESLIVFTEYRDTLHRLADALPGAKQLHGGLTPAERADVQRHFNEHGGLLLATDAAADGLNLQQRCRVLVNYELPWNPARLEQRIGRVDRIGQQRPVHAASLVARDTAEDLVVAALARRLARVAATLGERDRLAALLSDARTARSVIGGSEIDLPVEDPATPPLPRASDGDYPADRIAADLAAGAFAPVQDDVLVARVHARPLLPSGFVVLARLSVVTGAGDLVAERPLLLHVDAPGTRKPASCVDARRSATSIAAGVEPAVARLPIVARWFDEVLATHRVAVERRIHREYAIRRPRDSGEVQPGLFDRRAEHAMQRATATEDLRQRDHDRAAATLSASLDVRLECRVTGVLIVWS